MYYCIMCAVLKTASTSQRALSAEADSTPSNQCATAEVGAATAKADCRVLDTWGAASQLTYLDADAVRFAKLTRPGCMPTPKPVLVGGA